jgi:hypothetical protein
MKTYKTKNQKVKQAQPISSNFTFYWVFSGNDVKQTHTDAQYSDYLNNNYISKSNEGM